MTPSREAIEAALDAYFSEDGVLWRSFSTASQMKEDMEAALTAAYARDFPQPSKSDEERWRDLCEKDDRTSPTEYPDMALITFAEFAAIRAEAALAERERAARRLELEASRHEEALEGIPADTDDEEYAMHLVAATDFRSIAEAIRKGE